MLTTKEIESQVNTKQSVWAIRRERIAITLLEKYVKRRRCTCLASDHKKARNQFVEKYMKQQQNRSKIMFREGKKFNLVGPDAIHSYW